MSHDRQLTQRLKIPSNIPLTKGPMPKYQTAMIQKEETPGKPNLKRTAGPLYFNDPLNRKIRILCVGIDRSENQFTRNIESYGFEAIHINGDPTSKNYPNVDAAVCVISHMGHQAFWDLKEEFKAQDKVVFMAHYGFSEIKSDFENHFFKFIRELEALDVAVNTKLYFLLAFFAREKGSQFKLANFIEYAEKMLPKDDIKRTNVNNFCVAAKKFNFIESKEGYGKYRFLGFTPELCEFMERRGAPGVPIPDVWRRKPEIEISQEHSVEKSTEFSIEEIKEAVREDAPKIEPTAASAAPAQPEPEPVVASAVPPTGKPLPSSEGLHPAQKEYFDIVLRELSELSDRVNNFDKSYNPSMLQDKIMDKLPTLGTHKLRAIWELIQD